MSANRICPAGANGGAGGHALGGVVVRSHYTTDCPAGQSPDPRLRARRRYLLAQARLRQRVRDGN